MAFARVVQEAGDLPRGRTRRGGAFAASMENNPSGESQSDLISGSVATSQNVINPAQPEISDANPEHSGFVLQQARRTDALNQHIGTLGPNPAWTSADSDEESHSSGSVKNWRDRRQRRHAREHRERNAGEAFHSARSRERRTNLPPFDAENEFVDDDELEVENDLRPEEDEVEDDIPSALEESDASSERDIRPEEDEYEDHPNGDGTTAIDLEVVSQDEVNASFELVEARYMGTPEGQRFFNEERRKTARELAWKIALTAVFRLTGIEMNIDEPVRAQLNLAMGNYDGIMELEQQRMLKEEARKEEWRKALNSPAIQHFRRVMNERNAARAKSRSNSPALSTTSAPTSNAHTLKWD